MEQKSKKMSNEELLNELLKILDDATIYGSSYGLNVYSLVDEDFVGDRTYTLKEVREITDMTECEMARAILYACGIDDDE